MRKLFLTVCCSFTAAVGHSATVNWNATADTGLALANNSALTQGNLIRLGYFTISDSAVVAAKSNPTTLNNSWRSIADSTVGFGTGFDASFSVATSPAILSGADFGHQIYLWVLNAPTIGAATQQSIFYEPSANNSSWSFPATNAGNVSTTIDIGQAKTALGGIYLAGNYQASNAAVTSIFVGAGAPPGVYGAVQLESVSPVPEPSTFLVGAFAAMAGVSLRRRRQS